MNDASYLPPHKAEKLTATFGKRVKYTCHGRNLLYYVQQGMILEEIHSGIVFEQKAFLKDFIELCTKMRKEAKTKLEKDAWKRLANCLYGKVISIATALSSRPPPSLCRKVD